MSKHIGSEPLGHFYVGKRYKKRREWRGIKDTFYDYTRWLYLWGKLIGFTLKPNNLKGFFTYSWMLNYLCVPDFMDRHTEGLRGTQLRLAHITLELIIVDMCETLGKIFKADPRIGNDEKLNKKMVLFDENMMSEIMSGFPNLIWMSTEVPAVYTCGMMNQSALTKYIDATTEYGVPSDVCPMPAAELGCALLNDLPVVGACAVQCNTTCDGSLMGNGIESRKFNIPTFQLAVPIRHTQESVQEYAADEIRDCIAFIEEHTGEKFNWDYFFESMRRFNAETEQFKEWLDISRTDYPQVIGASLSLYRYGAYMAAGGRNQTFLDTDKKITALATKAYKNKELPCKEIRHRAIFWGVQAAYYTALPVWFMHCWGVVPLTDMLCMVSTETINTEDKDQAILDLAHLYENMIMRNRSNGGYEVGVEALWRYCEIFNVDIVVMYAHMGCKAMNGYHGLFEEEARKRGIHFIWVNHNLMKPEDASRREMRTEINRYMRTVLREEPLDPTLEDIDDSLAW